MHNTEERLQQLTTAELDHLKQFAEIRLSRAGLITFHAEDLVSKALNSVICGMQDDRKGRHPRPDELETSAAFLDFLRGAVCSTVEAYTRHRELHYPHYTMDVEPGVFQMLGPTAPDLDINLRDLKRALFSKLRATAPPRLHKTLDTWEEIFLWSDAIPNVPNARHAYDLRQLARKAFNELGLI
jgi:hypothetical protein